MEAIISLFTQDLQHLVRHYWKHILGLGVIVGVVLFLLNLFVGVSFFAQGFSDAVKDRLGMYFYIKEVPDQESATYQRVNQLQKDLQAQGLRTQFASKEDAFAFLQKKLPDVAQNLQEFDIQNTLPSTLYVMFANKAEYTILKNILVGYKDLFLNTKDFGPEKTLTAQEERTLTILSSITFVMTLCIVIIILLFIVIFAFLKQLFITVFEHFKKYFLVKKILGAFTREMIKDFLAINMVVVGIGLVICIVASAIAAFLFGVLMPNFLGIDLNIIWTTIKGRALLLVVVSELLVLFGGSLLLSYYWGWKLQKHLS